MVKKILPLPKNVLAELTLEEENVEMFVEMALHERQLVHLQVLKKNAINQLLYRYKKENGQKVGTVPIDIN